MIIRATSDLHLTQRTAEWVFAALEELHADSHATGGFTVLVGDIFDQPDIVHMPTWNRLREMLNDFGGFGVIVIPGNHDQYDGYKNALTGLASESVFVIESPTWTEVGRCIPYMRAGFADQWKDPKFKDNKGPHLVFCHQGFRGAYMNTMMRDKEGEGLGDLPFGHVIVAGHYHMPQNLGPLIYCGSPYETTFAEERQRKGWLRWDDARANPMPVRVPYLHVGAPRHFTIHWDPASGPPVRPPEATDTDILRIVTTATREEVTKAAETIAAAGLEAVPVIAGASVVMGRGILDPSLGLVQAATQYAEWKNPELPLTEFAADVKLWEGM